MARLRGPVDRVFDAVVPRAIGAVDPDELIERIDVNALLERIDVDALMQRIDIDALMARVDVDALIGRVDVDRVVQRVDIDGLMARVDVGALMARVDVDDLMGRVDVNGLMQQVDVAALAARAGIDQIVAEATTGLAARTLDLARRQVLGIDAIVLGLIDRLVRRARPTAAAGPIAGGPLARLLAFLIDSAVVSATFSLGVLLLSSLFGLFTGTSFDIVDNGGPAWAGVFVVWWFAYLWLGVAIAGRTFGKGVLGLRVVTGGGGPVPPGRAAVRALVLPVSAVGGVGLVPAVVGRQRRALHDLAAGTQVRVDWGDREAAVPAALRAWADRTG